MMRDKLENCPVSSGAPDEEDPAASCSRANRYRFVQLHVPGTSLAGPEISLAEFESCRCTRRIG